MALLTVVPVMTTAAIAAQLIVIFTALSNYHVCFCNSRIPAAQGR